MDDEQLEETLLAAAREYHLPPEPPRDAMWQAIEAARRADRIHTPARRWIPWAVAAAAVPGNGWLPPPPGNCWPPTDCCSIRRRGRTERLGCCSRISSWCSPRSRNSRPSPLVTIGSCCGRESTVTGCSPVS